MGALLELAAFGYSHTIAATLRLWYLPWWPHLVLQTLQPSYFTLTITFYTLFTYDESYWEANKRRAQCFQYGAAYQAAQMFPTNHRYWDLCPGVLLDAGRKAPASAWLLQWKAHHCISSPFTCLCLICRRWDAVTGTYTPKSDHRLAMSYNCRDVNDAKVGSLLTPSRKGWYVYRKLCWGNR